MLGLVIQVGLASLSSPDLPHEKNNDELVYLLESHFKITPNYHRSLIDTGAYFKLRKSFYFRKVT